MPLNAVALDSSVLIEHYRVKNKDNSLLSRLTSRFEEFCVSPLVMYEVGIGQTDARLFDLSPILDELTVLSFGEEVVAEAVAIYRALKKENKIIDHFDILIAATAIIHDLPLATLNRNHFERIRDLKMV